jgi:hypothetical protein
MHVHLVALEAEAGEDGGDGEGLAIGEMEELGGHRDGGMKYCMLWMKRKKKRLRKKKKKRQKKMMVMARMTLQEEKRQGVIVALFCKDGEPIASAIAV